MKKILFVHGFGVRKDARGLFGDIAHHLPDFTPVCTDLNDIDEQGNIVVSDFSTQVARLRDVWNREHKGCDIYIIAHSQGCLVTALANLPNIRLTIFLAPPTDSKSEKTIQYFKSKTGTEINMTGISKLARSDGSYTIVPASYWIEKDKLVPQSVYADYVPCHKTVVLQATEDEVISNEGIQDIFRDIELHPIQASHNFDGHSRIKLLEEFTAILKE